MLGMGEVFRYRDYSENAFVVFLAKNLDLLHEREHNMMKGSQVQKSSCKQAYTGF